MFETPILLIVFNRPEETFAVFDAIRELKPKYLYIAADGPRETKKDDVENCKRARSITERIDWDCEVFTFFSEKNRGCKIAVSESINWFFTNVEEGIILEDDCLASKHFFDFCRQLLEHYRNDERIMMISGTNFLSEWKSEKQSYHYTIVGGIWGWASWRRAWKHYDVNMTLWKNEEVKARLKDILCDSVQYKYRFRINESVYNKEVDTWDFQWTFAKMVQNGLTVVPSLNLITNIGFNENATHTKVPIQIANLKSHTMKFPISFNNFVIPDRDYDKRVFRLKRLKISEIISLLIFKIKKIIKF